MSQEETECEFDDHTMIFVEFYLWEMFAHVLVYDLIKDEYEIFKCIK